MKRFLGSLLAFSLIGCSFGSGPAGTGIPGTAQPAGGKLLAPPEVVSSHNVATFDLTTITSQAGLPEFSYNGQAGVAPTIRVNPGDTIDVNLHNELSGSNGGMSNDMNLHFHGLGTSPMKPSDDVLTMLAQPGQSLHYVVHVPVNQPPGLYWYHPHVHGETNYQVGVGGMSGALVVGGIAKHYPALATMPEQIMIVRNVGGTPGDDAAAHRRRLAGLTPNGSCPAFYSAFLTVNNQPDPTISFEPGKPMFFRILNATGHRTLDLAIGGLSLQAIGIDGFPLDTNASGPTTMTATHFVVAPAGRVEFVATPTKATTLRTLCFNSGPIGDPDPEQVLVNLTPSAGAKNVARNGAPAPLDHNAAVPRVGPAAALPPPAAHRVVTLTENLAGFYINGKAYDPTAPPAFVVHTGTVEQWTVDNDTSEYHDFHLHQVHFLVTSIDGVPVQHPVWTDTFVVPWQTHGPGGSFKPGTVSLIADFRSAIIKGYFLFHCHILDHEDGGMMAKIEAI